MKPAWIAGVAVGLIAAAAHAQNGSGPRNDLPQPYRTMRDWGELPQGVKWAAVTAVEPAPDGTIYVVHRCFANSCAGRSEAPILKYDAGGRLLKSWGAGIWNRPGPNTPARKASASMRRAMSTVPWCDGRCWNGTLENRRIRA